LISQENNKPFFNPTYRMLSSGLTVKDEISAGYVKGTPTSFCVSIFHTLTVPSEPPEIICLLFDNTLKFEGG